MGKKNIQPTTSSPVSRTLVVAPRPALEELRAEPQEGHISSLTGPEPNQAQIDAWRGGSEPPVPEAWRRCDGDSFGADRHFAIYTSYDGDDE